MKSMPFPSPSNENRNLPPALRLRASENNPWECTQASEPPPAFLAVKLNDGSVLRYAYHTLLETRLRDAGHLTLCIFGYEKVELVIEGRNLTELGKLLGEGKIKSLVELGPRSFARDEELPAIDKITVEEVTGPGV